MSAQFSPSLIAQALNLPRPTPEQAAVIEAPPSPTLVIAGAGAGKTETMAARVVWMVANGYTNPDEVLGLTFTRKAAQQLTQRIRKRLHRLAGSDLLRTNPDLVERLNSAEPEVSTYHSYAGRLVSEYGLLLPVEPSSKLLSETQLWQRAHHVVQTWDGELDTPKVPSSITAAVLALYGQLSEHLVTADDLRKACNDLAYLVAVLPGGRGGVPIADIRNLVATQEERVALLPLVDRLAQSLKARGEMDFGSVMSLAARLAADHAEVGKAQRERFRLILLDEYQDTGHSQRILLASLFGGRAGGGMAVTAVGDPMQSIYGWRGASAANLPRFADDFPDSRGRPASILPLTTSWRNPIEALALANEVTDPLRDRGVPVPKLNARPDPQVGDVRIALTETVAGEREWIAEQIAGEYEAARAADRDLPTAAVLVRRNADSAPLAEALRAKGLPVEIVGLGGLIHTPEVADLIAWLRLIADPTFGPASLRLLTGARWRLGLRDVAELWKRAKELAPPPKRDKAGMTLEESVRADLPQDEAETACLLDAVADPGDASRYSVEGWHRLKSFNRLLGNLRDKVGLPLPELVAEAERLTGIAVEMAFAQPGLQSRANLDAFADVVASYWRDSGATLGGLLDFLDAADAIEDGLPPGEVDVSPNRVQILTVHAAKGLEWEVVAVPHVVSEVFPSTRSTGTWMTIPGELPPALRGDRSIPGETAEGVPVLDTDKVNDQKQLKASIDQHKKALASRRADEDRRLFYVALTRTERALFVSGHHWAEKGAKPKGPSEFLEKLRSVVAEEPSIASISCWVDPPAVGAENPMIATPIEASFPIDPLGLRRADVEVGAAAVRAAMKRTDDPEPDEWSADVDAVLSDLRRDASVLEAPLPRQLSVSQLVSLHSDPVTMAARLVRPVPLRPNPLARRGTAFHAWIERRFGATRLLDVDELPGAADSDAAPDDDFEALQEAFLDSAWADRTPVEVELPFETTIGHTTVRGRIDAIFANRDGGWTVVDWKTGAEPGPADLAHVAVQLAVYRTAWARLVASRTGEAVDAVEARVGAAFHYVRSGRTVAPARLPSVDELATMIG
ncbi:MAG: DEAD/DEAH box helicase [Nocardiaceae bacterium]|nr:DEAD/DEAH box helicase [Nocardiaceae bacterium]